MKLVPSIINPATHFYAVEVTDPDVPPVRWSADTPMVILDPETDEWWAWPTGRASRWRTGPYEDSRAAVDAVSEVLELNKKLED